MAESLIDGIGSGYLAGVTSGNRLMVDLGGDLVISGLTIDAVSIQELPPTDDTKNNPAMKFEYDSDGNIGSITQLIDAGSYVQVYTYSNGSVLTNIGSYV